MILPCVYYQCIPREAAAAAAKLQYAVCTLQQLVLGSSCTMLRVNLSRSDLLGRKKLFKFMDRKFCVLKFLAFASQSEGTS
jgi:hypothetical protein